MRHKAGKFEWEFKHNLDGVNATQIPFDELPILEQVRLRPDLFEVILKDNDGNEIYQLGEDGNLRGFNIEKFDTNIEPTNATSFKLNVEL